MFVQWYAAIFTIIWVSVGYYKHGQVSDQKEYDFRNTFVSLVIHLPILGRVFGWW